MNRYSVANTRFKIIADKHFGFFGSGNKLSYFDGNNAEASLETRATGSGEITLTVKKWNANEMIWTLNSTSEKVEKLSYTIKLLSPNTSYTVSVNGKSISDMRASATGTFKFDHKPQKNTDTIIISTR
jgi:hypothetical protein